MEARDLARLAGVDAANLCRIENGKYSVRAGYFIQDSSSFGEEN